MPALRDTPPDYRQHLEIETPEHVVLDLEIAGIGSRALAAVLDMAILVGASLAVLLVARDPLGLRRAAGPGGARAAHDRRVRDLERLLHPVRGARPRPDAREADRRDPGRHGYRPRRSPWAPPPRATCSGSPTSFPRPTSSACCSWPSIPEASGSGDLVAGTVVSRDRPQEAPALEREAPREDGPPSIPELDDETFRLLAQFAARQADLDPAARTRLAAGLAARLADHPAVAGQSDVAHLLALHAAELARRQGGLSARGAAGAGHPVRRAEATPLGRVRAAGRARGRRRASTASGPTSSPTSPPAIARWRPTSPGRAPTARARRPCPGSSGWRRRATTRSTATSGAPGARSGSCSRASARRPWSRRAGTCSSPSSRSSCRPAAGFAVLRERPALAAELLAGRHAPAGGGRERAAGPRGGATWTWRRRTGHSWRRASSPTTSGSRSPASRAASSSGWAPWCCWRTTGWRSARSRATSPTPGCSTTCSRSSWGTERWSCSPSGWRARRASCWGARSWRRDGSVARMRWC